MEDKIKELIAKYKVISNNYRMIMSKNQDSLNDTHHRYRLRLSDVRTIIMDLEKLL